MSLETISNASVAGARAHAHWMLRGPDASVLQTEISFVLNADDERLRSTTEFFFPADRCQRV